MKGREVGQKTHNTGEANKKGSLSSGVRFLTDVFLSCVFFVGLMTTGFLEEELCEVTVPGSWKADGSRFQGM